MPRPLILATFAALAGCVTAPDSPPPAVAVAQVVQNADAVVAEFFEAAFMENVMRSPRTQSFLGMKSDYDKWDDISEARRLENLEVTKRQLRTLRDSVAFAALSPANQFSYRLFELQARNQIEDYKFRDHNYPINQMGGVQSGTPAFLINIHRVNSSADAEAYIKRLIGIETYFAQVIEGLERRAAKGIVAPRFVFPHVIADARNVITGAPFDASGEDSTLWADFKGKVANLELDPNESEPLLDGARRALLDNVRPAYTALIATAELLETRATTDDGAWKLPDGAAFYANALRRRTTTDMTPDEIHSLGLSEVARIHSEMRAIMTAVDFGGDLQEFFEFLRTDPRFYYPEGEEGRQAYLDEATAIIGRMRERLDELFVTKPQADLVVKAVEPFREKSAGKAFYQRPAMDGSRPGTYYANLYRMSSMPNYQMEALAYHEGIPGHHMQIAIAQELQDVPKFRKFSSFTAYSEGWGLYTELLPKEIGFYTDPYSDFGRLAMELWRACRLVVDTGIHHQRWTREQAIDYLGSNTPNPHGDVVKAIERYIVMPGQATAYKIGMLKIQALRAKTEAALGEKFDLREFHDVVLRNGPLPLSVLEEQIDAYVASVSRP